MKRVFLIIVSFVFTIATVSFAQVRVQPFESPVVHPDRSVTFNLKASNAQKVEISAQFLKGNQMMKMDSTGVWSITLGPVEPNIYPYNFVVDGITVSDPNNMNLFPNERFKASLVEIPGEKPLVSEMQDVPHGKVSYCIFTSKTLGVARPLIVYTPPGYEKSEKKYPVLYLVSGTTDTEETWFKVGRANIILDNLIAKGQAVPMIIVMPYGNMLNGTPPPTSLQAAEMYKVFNTELTTDIFPYVEANFRTIPNRESRAIAGFSRGGGQSLFTGFNNLDKFAYIGSYSAYLTPEVFEKYFSDLSANPDKTNQQLKLLWTGVGSGDFLYKEAIRFNELMKEKRIACKTLVTEGGHTWMNARHYLAETLQLYFK